MNELCGSCGGKCCVGLIEVFPDDELYGNKDFVENVDGEIRFKQMRTDGNNICVALIGGRCGVYGRRPYICRKFEVGSECCDEMRAGLKTVHRCVQCRLMVL